jgi:predicted Fe-Mo cluster-binding NifX family protein
MGLGPKAIDMLSSLGVEVYVGASGSVRDAIQMWKDGRLQQATYDTACKGHSH